MAEQDRGIGTDHIARALELVPSTGADDDSIRQGAAQLLGQQIIAMRSLGGGSSSAIFAVTTSADAVTTNLPGRDLGFELPTMMQTQMTRVAEQITQMQAKVATLPAAADAGSSASVRSQAERGRTSSGARLLKRHWKNGQPMLSTSCRDFTP